MLRYYVELMKRQFQQAMTYRANWIFGILSGTFAVAIQVFIWRALYSGKEAVAGATLSDMVTYVLIVQVMETVLNANFMHGVGGAIRRGTIATELIRPVRYKRAAFAEQMGKSSAAFVFELIPRFIVCMLLFGIKPPASGLHFLAFVVFLAGSMVLNYHILFLFGCTCFWLLSSMYFNAINGMLISVFSGRVVPLWFFPPFLQTIAKYLPFRFLFYIPSSVYLGKLSPAEFLPYFLVQWAWIIGIILLERLVWARGIRKVVIQGG